MRRDDGQAAVLVIGLFLVGLGFFGLAVDVARALAERAILRSAADRAALAGTAAVHEGGLAHGRISVDSEAARERAQRLLARSGVDSDVDADVRVHGPAVEVRLRRRVRTIFLRIVGVDDLWVAASATASPRVAGAG